MNQKQAQLAAEILGGEAWLRNDTWVVSLFRPDGSIVVISADSIAEFASDAELDASLETNRIVLSEDDSKAGFWIVEDEFGNVYYRNSTIEAGWRWREEAEEHSLAVQSKSGASCRVRRMAHRTSTPND